MLSPNAAGRTPSQPALLAATALARAVWNATAAVPPIGAAPHQPQMAYLQLHDSTQLGPFSWEAEPSTYPGARALLARGVLDGVMAEAVAERFARQRREAVSAVGHVRCGQSQCATWGADRSVTAAQCCEEALPSS